MIYGLGELWSLKDDPVIIAGNAVREDNSLWVIHWGTGKTLYPNVSELQLRDDRYSLSEESVIQKIAQWANSGDADAMWFLGYWYEGKNHPKSTWYYIAAMRSNPGKLSWAYDRICSDAKSAFAMCEDVPSPDLSFLTQIPEVQHQQIQVGKWQEAVKEAENAVHKPGKEPVEHPFFLNMRSVKLTRTINKDK